jgi:uncharacterized protein YaaN involved in tellurite resistance
MSKLDRYREIDRTIASICAQIDKLKETPIPDLESLNSMLTNIENTIKNIECEFFNELGT